MGGVPVLLMMAALGITYGWQPDNDGGVEYIIQIHPDELREMRSIGEVTSVIDPAVRGHVSRIVFQIGDSELPRSTPKHLAKKPASASSTQAKANDHTPIPIPQLGNAVSETRLLTLNAAVNSRPGAVMKPQTGTQPPSGFSLPPSLAEAAQQPVDFAGRPIDPAAASQGNVNGTTLPGTDANPGYRIPPPGSRPPSTQSLAAPAFTGPMPNPATNPMATSRAGGPTTDPTSSRDTSWSQYPAPATMAAAPSNTAASQSNVPSSLLPTNPFANRTNSTPPTSGYGASPVSSADTFGRTPAGLTTPTAGQASGFGAATQNNTSGQRGSFVQVPTAESIFGKNQAAPTAQASSFNNQANTGTPPTNSFGVPPGTSSYGQPSATSASQLPSRFGVNPSTGTATRSTGNYGAPQGYSAPEASNQLARPDPSLSPAQVAAGAWSVDAYGQPVDRSGRPVSVANASAPNRGPTQTAGGSSFGSPRTTGSGTFSSLGNPTSSNPIVQTSGQQSSFGFGQPPNDGRSTLPPRVSQTREPVSPSADRTLAASQGPTRNTSREGAGSSTSSNITLSSNSGSESLSKPKRVAAQPLFNGLLLISVVANIYLIFWLKNLRLQYHDLVAAKRIANSGNSAVS